MILLGMQRVGRRLEKKKNLINTKKLRNAKTGKFPEGLSKTDIEIAKLKADLAIAKNERDKAIKDLAEIMLRGGNNIDTCNYCTFDGCYERGGYLVCNPTWRGLEVLK